MTVIDLTPKLATDWNYVVYVELFYPDSPFPKLTFIVTRYRRLGRWRYFLDCTEEDLDPDDVELTFPTIEAAEQEIPKIVKFLNTPNMALSDGARIMKVYAGTMRWNDDWTLPDFTPEQERAFDKIYAKLMDED